MGRCWIRKDFGDMIHFCILPEGGGVCYDGKHGSALDNYAGIAASGTG